MPSVPDSPADAHATCLDPVTEHIVVHPGQERSAWVVRRGESLEEFLRPLGSAAESGTAALRRRRLVFLDQESPPDRRATYPDLANTPNLVVP